MTLLRWVLPILLLTSWSGPIALAADKDPMLKAIKARQSIMTIRNWNVGPLFGMAKGKIEYDAELASILANNLLSELAMVNGRMWPEGSDNSAYPDDTRALPEIWTTYPEVTEASKAYGEAVTELAANAGKGLDALRSVIGDVGNACQGCHEEYRAED